MKSTYRKSWVGKSFDVVIFDLGPLKVKRQSNLKMLITSGIFSLYVFYYCFSMFAMFGDTLTACNKASGISLVIYLFDYSSASPLLKQQCSSE